MVGCPRKRRGAELRIEEDRLSFALHVNVPSVQGLSSPLCTSGKKSPATLRRHALHHRIFFVEGRFLCKVDAGVGVKQHATHEHDDIDVGSMLAVDGGRLHRLKNKPIAGIRPRSEATKAGKRGVWAMR